MNRLIFFSIFLVFCWIQTCEQWVPFRALNRQQSPHKPTAPLPFPPRAQPFQHDHQLEKRQLNLFPHGPFPFGKHSANLPLPPPAQPTHHDHPMEKRQFGIFPVAENSTLRWLMNRLIDIGYYAVGVPRACRENSICTTANKLINESPDFIVDFGMEQVSRLPAETIGNHEYTAAWLTGLGAQTDRTICDVIYKCDKTARASHLLNDQIIDEFNRKLAETVRIWTESKLDAGSNPNPAGLDQFPAVSGTNQPSAGPNQPSASLDQPLAGPAANQPSARPNLPASGPNQPSVGPSQPLLGRPIIGHPVFG